MTKLTKRFLLFMGDVYYPAGGWGDYVFSSDCLFCLLVEFLSRYNDCGCDWAEIVDTHTGNSFCQDVRNLRSFIAFVEGAIL